jgi:HrpA-like RNA helicase
MHLGDGNPAVQATQTPRRQQASCKTLLRLRSSQPSVAAGDLLTYLNVWRAWEEHHRSSKWAHRNSLNQKALLRAADVRQQLLGRLRALRVPVASCEGDMAKVTQVCMASAKWRYVWLPSGSPASSGSSLVYRQSCKAAALPK